MKLNQHPLLPKEEIIEKAPKVGLKLDQQKWLQGLSKFMESFEDSSAFYSINRKKGLVWIDPHLYLHLISRREIKKLNQKINKNKQTKKPTSLLQETHMLLTAQLLTLMVYQLPLQKLGNLTKRGTHCCFVFWKIRITFLVKSWVTPSRRDPKVYLTLANFDKKKVKGEAGKQGNENRVPHSHIQITNFLSLGLSLSLKFRLLALLWSGAEAFCTLGFLPRRLKTPTLIPTSARNSTHQAFRWQGTRGLPMLAAHKKKSNTFRANSLYEFQAPRINCMAYKCYDASWNSTWSMSKWKIHIYATMVIKYTRSFCLNLGQL